MRELKPGRLRGNQIPVSSSLLPSGSSRQTPFPMLRSCLLREAFQAIPCVHSPHVSPLAPSVLLALSVCLCLHWAVGMAGAGPGLLFSSPEPALILAQKALTGFGFKTDQTPPLTGMDSS